MSWLCRFRQVAVFIFVKFTSAFMKIFGMWSILGSSRSVKKLWCS